ncbi:von willebrand factor type A domain-containing protein [Ditylenchus destructor]|uniref:von willebrand factor type A domain-containing protein n=1 Tax=Ditylenchus destructor TaxID=166010 RepID=A0AAD4R8K7_9BILA|nr:von willebrand factor type A domain-containing protein [Ditylenchus destructor]
MNVQDALLLNLRNRLCLIFAIYLISSADILLGCADFVFVLGKSSDSANNEQIKEAVINAAKYLELDSGLHRASLITGVPTRTHVTDFDRFATTEKFIETVRDLEFVPAEDEPDARRSSRSLDEALENAARLAISKRRSSIPIVLILVDDGTSAFSSLAATQGLFQSFLKKHHYIHFYIISEKAERLKNSLTLKDNEATLVSRKGNEAESLRSFIKCESRLKTNEFRRKPAGGSFGSTTSRSRNIISRCQFDIVLLMDFSGGVTDRTRQAYLKMATELISVLTLDEFASQVAMVRYSGPGRSETMFGLKKHRNSTELVQELRRATALGGTTRTADALLYAKHEFDEKFGGRSKARKILVLFSDGYSQDDPIEAAIILKKEKIHVYTVAVEDNELPPNLDQLRAVASDSQSVFLDAQFGSLKQKLAKCK